MNPVKRALIVGLSLLAFAFGTGTLLWYFAYSAEEELPAETTLAGLSDAATVHWQTNGIARIEARTPSDAAATLGYVHGTQRAWTLALWRQTALGRLGEWFGRGLLPLDRHARQLGLAARAEHAYAQLPDSTRRLLTAYAEGVNAAFRDGAARRHDELVLLDLSPAPWKPWHALAIERLMAWMATPPPAESTLAAADGATARFFETDARFRQWLHLYGFDRSVAWSVRSAQGPVLFQRHVFGASALPLFHEVVVDGPGASAISGASLPGTPFFPAGRTREHAWSLLLSSPLELSFAPVDSTALATAHERVRFHNGDETLLTTRRTPDALPLGHPEPGPLDVTALALPDTLSPADSAAVVDSIRTRRRSVWHVRWPGFRSVTDAAAWHSLTSPASSADFQLMEGHGLRVSAGAAPEVLGAPAVVAGLDDGVLVGRHAWAREQADNLRAQWTPVASPSLAALSAHDSSAWATERLTDLMPLLQMTEPPSERLREATTYLSNWNYTYDRASIGASVFEAWMHAYRAETDTLPKAPHHASLPVPEDSVAYVQWADSLRADSLARARQLRHALRRAVESLREEFGSDPRRWRWERVNASQRYFPAWSSDSLIDRRLRNLPTTRYAPIERPGRGHPSTLAGGPSLLDARPRAAAAWEGWAPLSTPERFLVRRFHPRTDVFLGRHTAPDRRPDPLPLWMDEAAAVTTLRPAP